MKTTKLVDIICILMLLLAGIQIGGILNAYYPDIMYNKTKDDIYWVLVGVQAIACIVYAGGKIIFKEESDDKQDPHPEHTMD